MLPPADAAILGAIAHGHINEIDSDQFNPDWLETETARQMTLAAVDLHRRGQTVNLINVLAQASRKMDKAAWPEVMYIWNNGFGDVSAHTAITAAKQSFWVREVRRINAEEQRLLTNSPGDIERWLPSVTGQRAGLIRKGEAYDSRPSAQADKPIPQIRFQSLLPVFNEIMRGGYRDGALHIYAGITKHGKSTTLKTHICDGVLQKQFCVLIITENTPQLAIAEIIHALSNLTMDEIAKKKFEGTSDETAEQRRGYYDEWLAYLDAYLRVFPWDWLNDSKLKQIARWYHPQVIAADYLHQQPGLFSQKMDTKDEMGSFADFLLSYAKEEGICFLTAGQIADAASQKLLKGDTSTPAILYGSAKVGHASDTYTFLKRHPDKKNYAYFRVWLDRFTGRLDTRHEWELDRQRGILSIPSLA